MSVPSYAFLAFSALAALLVNICTAPPWRRCVLAASNVAFLLTFTRDPKQLAPFAGLLVFGYVTVKIAERYKQIAIFTGFLVLIVTAFCWLKQYAFVPHGIFLPFSYMTVGMSYVFFRIAHLVIDAFQGSLPDRVSVPSYLSYTLSFTSLVSGPIQLYPEYRRMESEPQRLDAATAGRALERIILGFFKVSILSPLLSYAHDRSVDYVASGSPFGGRGVAIAFLLGIFPVYLYMNFSGYTDFVIGVARFLRLELPENFDRPFSSKGFIEFWGRWHMTLSQWFKMYVFSPMLIGLMRRFPEPNIEPVLGVLVYFTTFFLVGVWHGQTSMFLFYGVLQGVGVSTNKIYQIVMTKRLGKGRYRALCNEPVYGALSRGLTFTWFAFTLLWFWSSWEQLGRITALAGAAELAFGIVLLLLFSALVLETLERTGAWIRSAIVVALPPTVSYHLRIVSGTALAVLTLSFTVLLNAPAPHVIYKGF